MEYKELKTKYKDVEFLIANTQTDTVIYQYTVCGECCAAVTNNTNFAVVAGNMILIIKDFTISVKNNIASNFEIAFGNYSVMFDCF